MKKFIMGCLAVLFSGLFFSCNDVKAYASDDILPKAGFQEFLAEIYSTPTNEQKLPHYILTEEDADKLLRIGVLEAGETDIEGIANVMQVVMNRFESEKFPSTVSGVIFQDKQFCTAKRLAKANVTPEAKEALRQVVWGEYAGNDSLYFESCDGLAFASWADYTFSYGGHDFYK